MRKVSQQSYPSLGKWSLRLRSSQREPEPDDSATCEGGGTGTDASDSSSSTNSSQQSDQGSTQPQVLEEPYSLEEQVEKEKGGKNTRLLSESLRTLSLEVEVGEKQGEEDRADDLSQTPSSQDRPVATNESGRAVTGLGMITGCGHPKAGFVPRIRNYLQSAFACQVKRMERAKDSKNNEDEIQLPMPTPILFDEQQQIRLRFHDPACGMVTRCDPTVDDQDEDDIGPR